MIGFSRASFIHYCLLSSSKWIPTFYYLEIPLEIVYLYLSFISVCTNFMVRKQNIMVCTQYIMVRLQNIIVCSEHHCVLWASCYAQSHGVLRSSWCAQNIMLCSEHHCVHGTSWCAYRASCWAHLVLLCAQNIMVCSEHHGVLRTSCCAQSHVVGPEYHCVLRTSWYAQNIMVCSEQHGVHRTS